MPRNGSGSYAVVNTFTPSTKVRSSEVNANFTDIATALTGSLATNGESAMTGPVKAAAGTQDAPGLTWASELASGWYRAGAGDYRYVVAGADVLRVTAAGLTVYGALTATITIPDGSVTTAKLADANVTTAKIADANVTFVKLDTAAFASQAEAQAGSSSTKLMTPQRVSQAIAALSVGKLVARYIQTNGTWATLSTILPVDDSIPQSSEGTQIASQSVTITDAAHIVRVRFSGYGGNNTSGNDIAAAIFKDTTCIGASVGTSAGTGTKIPLYCEAESTPGVGTFTYSARVGPAASTGFINGNAVGRYFGGAAASVLIIEVLKP